MVREKRLIDVEDNGAGGNVISPSGIEAVIATLGQNDICLRVEAGLRCRTLATRGENGQERKNKKKRKRKLSLFPVFLAHALIMPFSETGSEVLGIDSAED